VRGAVDFVERRSAIYQRTATSIKTLERAGVAQRLSGVEAASIRDAREQLAITQGPDSLFDGEVLLLRMPKKSTQSVAAIAKPTPAMRAPASSNLQDVFEASERRAHDLAVAHIDESALKLGIEMSLNESIPVCETDTGFVEVAETIRHRDVRAQHHRNAHCHCIASGSSTEAMHLPIASAPARLSQHRCDLPSTQAPCASTPASGSA